MRGIGARHNSLVSCSPSASPRENRKLVSYWQASEASETLLGVTQSRFRYIWRASEASETLSGLYKFELVRYICIRLTIAKSGLRAHITHELAVFLENVCLSIFFMDFTMNTFLC